MSHSTHSSWRTKHGAKNQLDLPDQVTVMVTGYESCIHEPLLLEALANHPKVKEVYFVSLTNKDKSKHSNYAQILDDLKAHPIKLNSTGTQTVSVDALTGQPFTFDAYPLKSLLKRQSNQPASSETIGQAIKAYLGSAQPVSITTDDMNLCLVGSSDTAAEIAIGRRHPNTLDFVNDPTLADLLNHKPSLPFVSSILERTSEKLSDGPKENMRFMPRESQAVKNHDEVKDFMDHCHFNTIILKATTSVGGHGVYKVWREDANSPLLCEVTPESDYHAFSDGQEGPRIFPFSNFTFPDNKHPMLAMKWLQPEKGDLRVVCAHGEVLGCYMRYPHSDSWVANYSQNGTIEAVNFEQDLSPDNQKRIRSLAGAIYASTQMGMVSADFLEDENGVRYLSELNSGTTDDLVELQKYGQLQNADALAESILDDHLAKRAVHSLAQASQTDVKKMIT